MVCLGNKLRSLVSITLLTNVHLVKAMVFPVVMNGCESWTMCRRIDAFELWCWRRLLRVPWTARRANQSILKKIQSWIFIGRTDAEAETPILWPPDVKNWLTEKALMLGKIEMGGEGDDWGWDGWMISPTQCSPWGCKVRHDWATELNWTCRSSLIISRNLKMC